MEGGRTVAPATHSLVSRQGEGARFALRVPLDEAFLPADNTAPSGCGDAASESSDVVADWADGDFGQPLPPVYVAFRAPQARVRGPR